MIRGLLGPRDRKVLKGQLDRRVPKDRRDHKALRAIQVLLDLRGLKVPRDRKALKDQRDRRERVSLSWTWKGQVRVMAP